MNKDALKEILDVLQYVMSACVDLEQRSAAAEQYCREHSPDSYKQYLEYLNAHTHSERQTGIALAFEGLRKKLLQD